MSTDTNKRGTFHRTPTNLRNAEINKEGNGARDTRCRGATSQCGLLLLYDSCLPTATAPRHSTDR
jgi:hypothetical protein